jgi:Tfp pilus assembly protein PilO
VPPGETDLLRRVLTEQRRFLLPLAIVLVANVAVYAGIVYPMANRVADASQRAARAATARRAAQAELASAQGIVQGKERAEQELKTFYQRVLPADLSAANRTTYLAVAQLARKTNLHIVRRQFGGERPRDSRLARWKIDVTLEGSYEDIRRFIYDLETAPSFVVIDEMALGAGRDESSPLVLSLALSTYYRAADDAS